MSHQTRKYCKKHVNKHQNVVLKGDQVKQKLIHVNDNKIGDLNYAEHVPGAEISLKTTSVSKVQADYKETAAEH